MTNPILYNAIGKGYNSTRRADHYLLSRLRDLLLPKENGHYLDIGCGTGNYTAALAASGIKLTGVDPSELMLNEARQKTAAVTWVNGAVERIPFEDDSFDGAVATLTLHHWSGRKQAFRELHRVLRSGSRLVFLTSTPEQMHSYWLMHYFPRLIKASAQNMPGIEEVSRDAAEAGFRFTLRENYFVRPDLQDLFLHSGKHDPELYFDETVRKGISTFAALANAQEVSEGLSKLRNDIDSGTFGAVKEKFENGEGDYCFVVYERP